MNRMQESISKRSDMTHELARIEHNRAACPPAAHTPNRVYRLASPGPASTDHERAATERNGPVRHLMLVLVQHEHSVNPDWQVSRRVIGGRENNGRAEIVDLLTALRDDGEGMGRSVEIKLCVDALIAACGKPCESEAEVNATPMPGGPLSEREGAVLSLIADGHSNKEIARNLVIAPETVKSHVKRIFTKLNVEKRVDAVARARSMGILARETIGVSRQYNDHSFSWPTVCA
ncbi:MAG TPA: response regulator transcription factor [Rhizomicrobium sp.]|nr:response regulator transcription factor [Rhizomicrobium sp.]